MKKGDEGDDDIHILEEKNGGYGDGEERTKKKKNQRTTFANEAFVKLQNELRKEGSHENKS